MIKTILILAVGLLLLLLGIVYLYMSTKGTDLKNFYKVFGFLDVVLAVATIISAFVSFLH
ncbi:MAG: hypothetical protein UIM53_03035 [Acutalibacteraceae bacterium]|nr:hypothetical protein [Acutalibacteraceae bacterium]